MRWTKRLAQIGLCATVSMAPFAANAATEADPWEGFNRAMFSVNEGIDVVVKPVAQPVATKP